MYFFCVVFLMSLITSSISLLKLDSVLRRRTAERQIYEVDEEKCVNRSSFSDCKADSLTEKRHSLSWRSSTSLTSTHMFLFVGACQAPASVPLPGRHGRTLLANWRHSGQVNSPLSTEKPWRTWSFWGKWDERCSICLVQCSYKRAVDTKKI